VKLEANLLLWDYGITKLCACEGRL